MSGPGKGTEKDDELYKRYLSGESSAGDELMLRYADMLTGYVDGLVNDFHAAEDIMLESFAAILINKPRIREGGFKAYLFKAARNKASRLWKKRYRANEVAYVEAGEDEAGASERVMYENMLVQALSEANPSQVDMNDPEQMLLKEERSAEVRSALDRIAPQYKEALYLVYCMELSYDQAAEVLKCNKKKINNLLNNGKTALRAELQRNEKNN